LGKKTPYIFKSRKVKWVVHVACMEVKKVHTRIPRHRSEDNAEMDLKRKEWEELWQTLVIVVMNQQDL
jgi:hypothetical protein